MKWHDQGWSLGMKACQMQLALAEKDQRLNYKGMSKSPNQEKIIMRMN